MRNLLLTLLAGLSAMTAQADGIAVYGIWLSEAENGHIEVSDCGDGTPCGRLVWIDPKSTDTELDIRNKDKALRSRPLLGVPIIWGYERSETGWTSGHIYNPEDGKTFRSSLQPGSDNTLRVKGCLGPFCITNTWTRLTAETQTAEASDA